MEQTKTIPEKKACVGLVSGIFGHRFRARYWGVSKKAEGLVQKLAPGGQWNLEISTNGEAPLQLMAWYSKFAVYAQATVQSEEGFECLGIDFDSINAFFRTRMGFVWVGTGESDNRIEEADVEFFSDIYSTSCRLWPCDLPFEEASRAKPQTLRQAIHEPGQAPRTLSRTQAGGVGRNQIPDRNALGPRGGVTQTHPRPP